MPVAILAATRPTTRRSTAILTDTQWAVLSIVIADAKDATHPRHGCAPSATRYRFVGSERKIAQRLVARGLLIEDGEHYAITPVGHAAYAAATAAFAATDDGFLL